MSDCNASMTYQPPSRVVVQVDRSPGVLTCLLCIDVLFGDPLSEINIIAAATPQPATTACSQHVSRINRSSLREISELCHLYTQRATTSLLDHVLSLLKTHQFFRF